MYTFYLRLNKGFSYIEIWDVFQHLYLYEGFLLYNKNCDNKSYFLQNTKTLLIHTHRTFSL